MSVRALVPLSYEGEPFEVGAKLDGEIPENVIAGLVERGEAEKDAPAPKSARTKSAASKSHAEK